MKKGQIILSSILFLLITSCSNQSKKTSESTSTNSATSKELSINSDSKVAADDNLRMIVNQKIANKYYLNTENGIYTVIRFEPLKSDRESDLPFGAMVLSQMKCNFIFDYEIHGNKIDTKFIKSLCGRTSTDKTFYYDQDNDFIYMTMGGQKFIFKELIN
jgi:hypothetical protein